ncbi:hypothetical protein O181_034271 [Austropuccinia psidii MF-1]|uniref:Uncharacterized protein n=1 Tax=Austropuccinia psidii MF-1 TaxID=1389203 RepID=A0A9Q3D616_9BASI|nr:hypothetical protein [Austropuccinia psidii MF-1]
MFHFDYSSNISFQLLKSVELPQGSDSSFPSQVYRVELPDFKRLRYGVSPISVPVEPRSLICSATSLVVERMLVQIISVPVVAHFTSF